VVLVPLSFLLVYLKKGGWKYGFTFIQSSVEVSLFIAFAMAFMLVMYHVLSFEIIGKSPVQNYLRVNQKVKIKGNVSLTEIGERISNGMKIRDFQMTENSIKFRKLVHFSLPDHISISKEGDLFSVESKPFSRWWILDFGRNFSNVKEIAKWIKQ